MSFRKIRFKKNPKKQSEKYFFKKALSHGFVNIKNQDLSSAVQITKPEQELILLK